MRPRALIVDDDKGFRESLLACLPLEGFDVAAAANAAEALTEIAIAPPDIVVLDVAMPGMDGRAMVRQLRRDGRSTAVCMLSARDDINDRVEGLAAGADDYVVKPFSLGELAARMHALVRLKRREPDQPVTLGALVIEPQRRLAHRAGRDLELSMREFDVLSVFAHNPGRVLSRRQLLDLVWGYDWDGDPHIVDVFVGYLRRKLEANDEPRILWTVRGVGFVLRS